MKIKIIHIAIEKSPKVRATPNESVIAEYAEHYRSGNRLPPVVAFDTGEGLILADGLHRCMAAIKAGLEDVEADIRKGGYGEALQFALLANAKHGLPRTAADKRTCIQAAIMEWPKTTDAQIALMCEVSNHLVTAVRGELEAEDQVDPEPVRVDAKGRKVPAAKGKSKATSDKDALGNEIPVEVMKFWERSEEVRVLIRNISEIRNTLKQASELKDPMYGEVNISSALADLNKAYTSIQCAMPYAICTQCQGHPETQKTTCRLCCGRGLISKFRYDHLVAIEVKEIKTKGKK